MKRQQRTEVSGPLSGHVRKGRRYLSPLAATGVLHLGDWVRDDLPDLLWPVLTLAELGSSAALSFVRWQGAVQRDLAGRAEPRVLADGLDGRLTSLDRLTEHIPDAQGPVRDRALEFGLLPQPVARALASYPERPAPWLVDLELSPPDQAEVDLLSRAIVEALRDGHRESIIKCLSIWSAVQARTFTSSSSTIDLLKPYPNDLATRSKADSAIRAMWGAQKGAVLTKEPTRFDAAIKWAKIFWGFNSMTTRCIRGRDGLDEGSGAEEGQSKADPGKTPEDGTHLRQLAMDLLSSYVEALETSPSRLYDQERQEVHSGLVARAGREVITALGVPDLWSMEHGAHVGRILVEVRIYLQWMGLQGPSIYRSYQEYGSGKAKLYTRIASEFPEHLLSRPDVKKAVDELDRLSHSDDVIDHRIVDTGDSFSGKSLRAMAQESGLIDLYRHAYYIASGVTHSEWWSVETHCMERCLNILHRGHLIPSLSLSAGGNVDLAESWVNSLHALIRMSLDILETDKESVASAFSWLTTGEGAASVPGPADDSPHSAQPTASDSESTEEK
ncbi:DUF5677 domain-containing protein [Micromonospora sp. NPDC000442]|uniref:DUF5677 domain-containing protein n=1 Tax=Micromonospora sp. NPDC000442 TaxID=3364217 RepID=UPI0036BF6A61